MNYSVQTELKLIVERVVRPLDASLRRKYRIREEMLSHVLEAYDAELAAGYDETKAIARTQRRFGDPTLIARQLQSTVPPSDAMFKKFEAHENESMLQAGLKFAAIETIVFFAILFVVFVFANTFDGLSLAQAISLAGSMPFVPIFLTMPLWLLGTTVMMVLMERSLSESVPFIQWPPKTPWQFFCAAWKNSLVRTAFVLAPGSIIAMGIVPWLRWPTSVYDWNQSTLAMLAITVLALTSLSVFCGWILALTVVHRRNQRQQWTDLRIEEIA